MQIEPNGLLAGDPLHPLVSGHPFFHGNVMQGNGIDGMAVAPRGSTCFNPTASWQYIGPDEANRRRRRRQPDRQRRLGSDGHHLRPAGDDHPLRSVLRSQRCRVQRRSRPDARPATLLARAEPRGLADDPGRPAGDGARRRRDDPQPGLPVVVKLLSENTPNGAGSLAQFGSTGSWRRRNRAGPASSSASTTRVDPTASPLVDPGAYSQIRILGIPGNQTTGQQRVPVIMTSLRDDTVGRHRPRREDVQHLQQLPDCSHSPSTPARA